MVTDGVAVDDTEAVCDAVLELVDDGVCVPDSEDVEVVETDSDNDAVVDAETLVDDEKGGVSVGKEDAITVPL